MKIEYHINKKTSDMNELVKKNCRICNDLLMEDYYIFIDRESESVHHLKTFVVVCLKCLSEDTPRKKKLKIAEVLLTLEIL